MPTDQIKDVLTRARAEVRKVIIGQDDVVEKALIAIFTGHHALIEGVPGVAKTLLVRTLARVLGCEFNRIQFTPDLMPADITGTNVFNLQRPGALALGHAAAKVARRGAVASRSRDQQVGQGVSWSRARPRRL